MHLLFFIVARNGEKCLLLIEVTVCSLVFFWLYIRVAGSSPYKRETQNAINHNLMCPSATGQRVLSLPVYRDQ